MLIRYLERGFLKLDLYASEGMDPIKLGIIINYFLITFFFLYINKNYFKKRCSQYPIEIPSRKKQKF